MNRQHHHKFHAKPTVTDGIRFDSKKEARRYATLLLLQQQGAVVFFLRQVGFDLGGGTRYRCDFQVFWSNGEVTFEDVKGVRTASFIKAKAQVENAYPVEILET